MAKPLNLLPKLVFGNMPNDGGFLIINSEERLKIIEEAPEFRSFIRRLIGARDFINGQERYCLWLTDAAPNLIRNSKFVMSRIASVRDYRESSKRAATKALASFPTLFGEIRHTGEPYILLPRHSSERRDYMPIGFFDGNDIAHDSCLFAPSANKSLFGLITSAMHMSWLRHIGGRIKSDYRYAIGLVYNTFPLPPVPEADLAKLEPLAQAVLDTRAAHADATLSDLYDPDTMPANLRRAHQALDRAVDRLYRKKGFTSDRERVEHLLAMYEKMTAPLAAPALPKKRGRRRSA